MSLEVRPRITPSPASVQFEIAFWIAWFAQDAISTLAFYGFYPIAGQEACHGGDNAEDRGAGVRRQQTVKRSAQQVSAGGLESCEKSPRGGTE